MTTNKMTNKKALEFVLESYEVPADVREKLEKMVESLARKATSGTRKPTAKQVENEGIRGDILELMSAHPETVYSIADISKAIPALNEANNQRVSALVSPMVKDGRVVKTMVKGKANFQIAAAE